jgi:hypothetical protein
MTNSVTTKPDSLSDGEGGHTPGPYVVVPRSFSSAFFLLREGATSDEPAVAEVYRREDAAFLASAPDLLEALKAVTQSTEWPTMERDTQDAVLAAIAKAEAPPPNLEGK